MLDKDMLIKVKNRSTSMVGYSVPDLGITRHYEVGEEKEVTYNELVRLSYMPGGISLLKNTLLIRNAEAVASIIGEVEVEYFYDNKDVKDLLLNGSLEALEDCLDFAPRGVIDLVEYYAVNLQINDLSKRQAIQNATGLNINTAILYRELSEEEHVPEKKQRRVAIPTETSAEEKPARRTSPYKNIKTI